MAEEVGSVPLTLPVPDLTQYLKFSSFGRSNLENQTAASEFTVPDCPVLREHIGVGGRKGVGVTVPQMEMGSKLSF